jgi:hypothetical protein
VIWVPNLCQFFHSIFFVTAGEVYLDEPALQQSKTFNLFGPFRWVNLQGEPYDGSGECYSQWCYPDWWPARPTALFWKGFQNNGNHLRLIKRILGMTVPDGTREPLPKGSAFVIASPEAGEIMKEMHRLTGYGLMGLQWIKAPF